MSSSQFFTASAPGRMDVMGGIADYSGSLVLQMPIRESTTVEVKLRNDGEITVTSNVEGLKTLTASFRYPDLLKNGNIDYDHARMFFKADNKNSWAAYIAGCALVLQKEEGIQFMGGDFAVTSNVPLGKGVSSSASVEVATMKALCKAFNLHLSDTKLPRFAQQVENKIVGAPCGLMDQLASYFGEPGKLIPIVCQPDLVGPLIEIPDDIVFAGIDSGVRHHVGDASYGDVRCAAFMGYSIIARELGITEKEILNAKNENNFSGLPFQGYLCNITVFEFEERFRSILPERLSGEEFLDKYKLTIDPVTHVLPGTIYKVLECTAHPVYENQRVKDFVHLFSDYKMKNDSSVLKKLGALMLQSHESYSRCGLGSDRTNEIVKLALSEFSSEIYGARITGGGSGGTVCLLAKGDKGKRSVRQLHNFLSDKYQQALSLLI
jgi:galactokinase